MTIQIKSGSAGNTPTQKKTTYLTENNMIMIALQDLRDIAFERAMKYRFDPILNETHEEYLTLINGLLKEYAK